MFKTILNHLVTIIGTASAVITVLDAFPNLRHVFILLIGFCLGYYFCHFINHTNHRKRDAFLEGLYEDC